MRKKDLIFILPLLFALGFLIIELARYGECSSYAKANGYEFKSGIGFCHIKPDANSPYFTWDTFQKIEKLRSVR